MTNEELMKEFKRWMDAGRPQVYVRTISHFKDDIWKSISNPIWSSNEYYIVNDEQAELRKLQIEKPDTQFQWFYEEEREWLDLECSPLWDTLVKYRIKPSKWYEDPNMYNKPCWFRNDEDEEWELHIFKGYGIDESYHFISSTNVWKYAKPVKSEDLYQRENYDII